jgi:hypothetical protein
MAFDSELPEYLPQLDEQSKDDMLRKHVTLLAFDFEEDLSGIVHRAVHIRTLLCSRL